MPRYFISLEDGGGLLADPVGQELPDLEAARRLALRTAGQSIPDEMAQGIGRVRLTMTLADEMGERLEVLPIEVSAG